MTAVGLRSRRLPRPGVARCYSLEDVGTSRAESAPRFAQPTRSSHVFAETTGGSSGGTKPRRGHCGRKLKPSKYAAVDIASRKHGRPAPVW